MYLLIYDEGTELAVESDLQAEVEVQLGMPLSIGRVSALLGIDPALGLDMKDRVRALRIDSWSQILVDLLDTHVVRLERTGAQFLFLTTAELSDQLLVAAPNFRNRLTEVLRIVPDDPSGAGSL